MDAAFAIILAAVIVFAAVVGAAWRLVIAIERAVRELPIPQVTVELVAVRTEHDVSDSKITTTCTVGEIHGATRVESTAVGVRGSHHIITGCHVSGADVGVGIRGDGNSVR